MSYYIVLACGAVGFLLYLVMTYFAKKEARARAAKGLVKVETPLPLDYGTIYHNMIVAGQEARRIHALPWYKFPNVSEATKRAWDWKDN